jgi:hypothetical protein
MRTIDLNVLRETVGKLDEGKINALLDEFAASNPDGAETWKVEF